MAAISTIIAGIGVAAGIGGTLLQYSGAQKAEKKREQMANLEAKRTQREQFRQAQIARAQALAAGVANNTPTGSSVQGGMGAATSQASYNVQGTRQGRQIGSEISSANQMVNLGAAISSLGGGVVNMADTFGRVGEYMTQPKQGYS